MTKTLEKEEYKFSVVMPIYIHEKDAEFRMALDSIINQTLMPNEILIVADKDIPQNTKNILDEYQAKYPEIFYPVILDEEASVGKARAISVEKAKYNIIANMDADDISRNDRFEKQINFLKKHPDIDVIGSCILEFENEPENIYSKRDVPLAHEDIYKYSKFRSPINNMSVMYKKAAVIGAGNYSDLREFEDYELWTRMIIKGYKFANLSEHLVNVRAGRDMIIRRQGLKVYFQYEYPLFKSLYNQKFITFKEFLKAIISKFFLRAIPNWAKSLIYYNFLHKKVSQIDLKGNTQCNL